MSQEECNTTVAMTALVLPALLQLASPALPVGGFSYSSGIESAVEQGWIHDAASAERWISAQCEASMLSWDIPLWGAMFDAWVSDVASISDWNDTALAARETAELRAESAQMGHALRRWCLDVAVPENTKNAANVPSAQIAQLKVLAPLAYVTAHPLAAHLLGLTREQGALAYAMAQIEGQLSAAGKAIPLGQTAVQRLLLHFGRTLAPKVQNALKLPFLAWSSATPFTTIASMKHETQYTRLFRS